MPGSVSSVEQMPVKDVPQRGWSTWISLALLAYAVLRVFYNGLHELSPDEAYYWTWSRHLAPGYLDHPPMVAVSIWLSTWMLGTNELTVRLPAAIYSAASIAITLRLAWLISGDRRVVIWSAAILMCSPLMAVLGTIITPDSPAAFFSICTLWVAVGAVREPKTAIWRWPLFGLLAGLAMTSKYTAVLIPMAVVLMLLTSASGRRHFARPWLWLSAVTAVIGFAPVIWWNATHDWVSFRFQLAHGAREGGESAIENLNSYLGGQAAAFTPILFGMGVMVLVLLWRRLRQLPDDQRLLMGCTSLILTFFCLTSLRHPAEVNWPTFAYLPLAVLLAMWAVAADSRRVIGWLRAGVIVAGVMSVLMHVPELAMHSGRSASKFEDIFGWRQLAQQVDAVRGDATVVCSRYQDAAELSFYLAGRPDVWTYNYDGGRSTAFEMFEQSPDVSTLSRALFVSKSAGEANRYFPVTTVEKVDITYAGRVIRSRYLVTASR